MALSSPYLLAVPYEVLVRIAFETALIDVLGPPTHLVPLLCTCRYVYDALRHSYDLYASIFKAKFDTSAAHRRLGPMAMQNRRLSHQLKKYCAALRRLREGNFDSPHLKTDFLTAFIMMTENDGKNAVQLIDYAHMDTLSEHYVRTRLHSELVNGWPTESDTNNLAVWLMWMTTNMQSLLAEGRSEREALIRLLLPFVLAAFRYPSYHAPDLHYTLPLSHEEFHEFPHSIETHHGPYPHYPNRQITPVVHFDERIVIQRPPIAHAAQLLYFSRRELNGLFAPSHLPENREQAIQRGEPFGPTHADYAEFNSFPGARLVNRGDWDWRHSCSPEELKMIDGGLRQWGMKALSRGWDADWERLTACYDPLLQPPAGLERYVPGSLVGRWVGRMLIPQERPYMLMIPEPNLPSSFSEMNPRCIIRPLMLTIKEHHCISPEEPLSTWHSEDDFDEGIRNGYMPPLLSSEERDKMVYRDEEGNTYRYETIKPGEPSRHNEDTCLMCPRVQEMVRQGDFRSSAELEAIEEIFEAEGLGHSDRQNSSSDDEMDVDDEICVDNGKCTGLLDITFSGLTEKRHADAWCDYSYYGRLRSWDGLIVLVGVPNDINARVWGRWVFRGYLHGGQNFTGRWRHVTYDVYSPPWEGPFTLSKRPD